MTDQAKASWALAAVCFFWGTTYFAIRIAVSELPPALFCAVRFFLAGMALFIYALWRGQAFPRGSEWFDLAVVGILLLVISNGTLAWAEQWVPTGIASLLTVTTPLWLALFARATGEAVRARAVAGLSVGFCGILVILWPELRHVRFDSGYVQGALGILGAASVWAVGSIYSKRCPSRSGPVMAIAIETLIASPIFLIIALLSQETSRWHPTPRSWLAIAYLAVFGSIVGYGSYIYALSKLPATVVSIYAYINPIVAVLLGIVFLGESFNTFLALGIPLVLAGVYLVNSAQTQPLSPEGPIPWPKRWLLGWKNKSSQRGADTALT